MRNAVIILTLALLMFSTIANAGTVTARLQQAISAANTPTAKLPVIVRFQTQLNLNVLKGSITLDIQQYRAELIRALEALNKISVDLLRSFLPTNQTIEELWLINALAVDLPANRIAIIAGLPFVNTLDLDIDIELFAAIPGTQSTPTWNLDLINAPEIWSYGYTGQGVVIASMDSGVDINHPDLRSKYRGGTNSWFDPYGQHATPVDVLGHGTQTMGIMVGGNASGSSIGVAPGATWIAAKIFNDSGVATTSAVHAGFQWLLDPDGDPTTDDAPDVVNNSWGITGSIGGCDSEFINDVEMLKSADIAVVFAAGNSGPAASTSLSPANYVDTFAVGAVDEYSNVAYFSSRGPSACENDLFPDVIAPGMNIKTSSLTYGGAIPNSYVNVSGTSFAAPHVAATIALIRSAMPQVTVDELSTVMRASAGDIFPTGPDTDTGYGLFNAQSAYFQLPIDTDGDGVVDGNDNCILVSNFVQDDSDGDGFGNNCDADLNNDGQVNLTDYSIFRTNFGTTDPDSDFNNDGVVNLSDYSLFRRLFAGAPGPSALVP